jgi:DNA-binding NtrC family response regulator
MDVLLVERDEGLRGTIAEALTAAGLDVAELPEAQAALAYPQAAGAPRFLVTDLDLGPEMDGAALADAAQRRWPTLGVIYMSSRQWQDGVGQRGPVLPVDGAAVLRAIHGMRESFRAH